MNDSLTNFNLIARPYRWLEHVTFGKALENCRTFYLPRLLRHRHALVLGDGDGRFTARLLATNRQVEIVAVDTSTTMLSLLRKRCAAAILGHPARLHTVNQSALDHTPSSSTDLIVAHFFFDCLTQPELDTLTTRIARHADPEALWLVSDFRIPAGPMHLPARLLIRSLYLAFRILTGLRTTQLPDHAAALTRAGLTRIAHHHLLTGLLTTELWQAQ